MAHSFTSLKPGDSKRIVRALLILFGFFIIHFVSCAQSGTLDLSFQASASQTVNRTLIQPDGKIILAGEFTSVNGVTRNRIARLNTDGTLDTSFDPGAGPNSAIQTISLQTDGKIIIGGNFNIVSGSIKPYIARLNSNGTLDASFSVPGSGVNNLVIASGVQSDGKIVIGGVFTAINGTNRNYLARLNANGTLDATFNPGTGANDVITTCSIQSDDKIIFAGSFTSINGTPRFYVARLNTNGTIDTSFDPGTQLNSTVLATCIQTDGKILVGGTFTSNGISGRDRIARLNTDGALDPAFDPSASANTTVAAIKVQPDGKIVVGGNFNILNNTIRNLLGRLNADGTLDTSFDPQDGANNNIMTISLQANGAIIIGGGFTAYNNIARNNIARIRSCTPINSTLNVTACESYQMNNQTYTASGTYTQTLSNSLGCDSTVTLNLTILDPAYSYLFAVECDEYTWTNGITYTESGIYSDTLVAANGCDSIATLQLTINHSYLDTLIVSSCGPYYWDFTQTNVSFSGTYSHTFITSTSCDSTQVLQIQVNTPPTASVIELINGNLQETGGMTVLHWLDCTNNSIIANSSSIYAPTANGTYAAIVYDGTTGCSDTSNCVVVNDLGVSEPTEIFVILCPNPTNNLVTVSFAGNEAELTIYDAQGKLIRTSTIVSGQQVSLRDVQTGVYFFELVTDKGNVVKRVVKN